MRRQTSWLLSMTALIAGLTMSTTTWAREEPRFDIAFPDVNRPSTAAAQKILLIAYAQMGIKANFIAMPAARAMSMWSAGKLDAFSAKIIDSGLPDSVKSSVPIILEEAVVFTSRKNFTVDGYDSLKPYLVGYVNGVTYFEDRLKNVPQKETAPNLESLFRKLDAGRTDVAVDSRFAFCLVQKLGLNHIRILEPSLERRPGYHFLHSRHQHLLSKLDDILQAMEKDGSIKRIQEEVMQEYMTQCTDLSENKRKKAAG